MVPEIAAALIGVVGTAIAASAGVWGITWQLKRQGDQSREAIAENERRKLKAAMYEDVVRVSGELSDAAFELSSLTNKIYMELFFATHGKENGTPYQNPATRYQDVMNTYGAFSDAVIRFILLIEQRRYIDVRLLVFRTAMNVVLHEMRDAMHGTYLSWLLRALPIDLPAGNQGVPPYQPPDMESFNAIRRCGELISELTMQCTSYVEDLQVEMQNVLLGDLFRTEVPHREPANPAEKVIRLDQAEVLEKWFLENTAWGKTTLAIEEDAKRRFAIRPCP